MCSLTHASILRIFCELLRTRNHSRKYKKARDNARAILRGSARLLVVASLVEGHRGDRKFHALDVIGAQKLRGLDSSTKLLDLRDVRRVHADKLACGNCAIELRLRRGNLAGSIRTRRGEVQHATAGRLDRLDGRRSTREHKRGTFRVQVRVGVLNELVRAPDVGECEGHVGGGGKVNRGHF